MMLMITIPDNVRWNTDVKVNDLIMVGLPAQLVERTAKVAVTDARDAERIGMLAMAERACVGECFSCHHTKTLGEYRDA
ncbi:growth inhibitor PemK [Skermanella stibiiresistens SB22]|uniref:Growth inhibitor PemK n=1 Tax=Skermanella stibiiresistens SB22 TaxID=1385369 RepID=W9H724_9PROT|nr:growth inhibitor PemK [Skermanella stibiiresistens SB22]